MEKRDNIIMIVLIIAMIIIAIGIGIFCFSIMDEDNSSKNEVEMFKNNNVFFDDYEYEVKKDKKNETNNNSKNTIIENNSTLEKMCNIFNNSTWVKKMENEDAIIKATTLGNQVTISIDGFQMLYLYVTFELNENILSTTIVNDEGYSPNSGTKILASMEFIDCLGQIKGLKENQVFDILWSDESKNLTINNEGVEIQVHQTGENKTMTIKADINNNFAFFK